MSLVLNIEVPSPHWLHTFQGRNLAPLPCHSLFAPLFARHLLHTLLVCFIFSHMILFSPLLFPPHTFLQERTRDNFLYNICNHTKHIFPAWLWYVHKSIKTICACIFNIPQSIPPPKSNPFCVI